MFSLCIIAYSQAIFSVEDVCCNDFSQTVIKEDSCKQSCTYKLIKLFFCCYKPNFGSIEVGLVLFSRYCLVIFGMSGSMLFCLLTQHFPSNMA